MKKLLHKENINKEEIYSMPEDVIGKIYANKFSGIRLLDGKTIKGACINCSEKFCIEYSEQELNSKHFATFPHNTSSRVCPSSAITIDSKNDCVQIDHNKCFGCGLCLHRCPFAAIQMDLDSLVCNINISGRHKIIANNSNQLDCIDRYLSLPKEIAYTEISEKFASQYQSALSYNANKSNDLSEIVVRNSLVNMGIVCNTNAAGNNHIRIEFFAEQGDNVVIGESNIKSNDSLAVTRRILDDLAVLISRYGFTKDNIVPLAVHNGLPNKRTDYYEVVEDIKNVLGIQINTITYHILFMLNLFDIKVTLGQLSEFIVNRHSCSLLDCVRALIDRVDDIDKNTKNSHYTPLK